MAGQPAGGNVRGQPGRHAPASADGEHSATSAPGDDAFRSCLRSEPRKAFALHLSGALAQLRQWIPGALDGLRLPHGDVNIWGTPRRLIVAVDALSLAQADEERIVKGLPVPSCSQQRRTAHPRR